MQHLVAFVVDPINPIAMQMAQLKTLRRCNHVATIHTFLVYNLLIPLSSQFQYTLLNLIFLSIFFSLGRFIGSAHSYCNLRARLFSRAILIAHAGSRFDQVSQVNVYTRSYQNR